MRKLMKFFIAIMSTVAIIAGIYTFVPPFMSHDVVKSLAAKEVSQKFTPRYDNVQYVHQRTPSDPTAVYGNLEDVLRRGELVVCALKRDYNQFFQMKVGDGYIGEDVKLASELGKALGVRVVYKMAYESNDDVVDAIYRGEGDVGLAKLSYTHERARKVTCSIPYVTSRKMIMLSRVATIDQKNNTLEKVLNNENAKIAVMKNTSYESFARNLFPDAQICAEDKWEDGAIAKLEKGEVMAVVRDELRIKTLINAKPNILLNFMPVILEGEGDSISAIVVNREHSLISYINNFLKNEYKVLNVKEILDIYRDYIK